MSLRNLVIVEMRVAQSLHNTDEYTFGRVGAYRFVLTAINDRLGYDPDDDAIKEPKSV